MDHHWPQSKALEQKWSGWVVHHSALCKFTDLRRHAHILKWFGVGAGDEVIVPAYTHSATALSVLHCGAKPVMIDIKDDFHHWYWWDQKKITPNTKVIMPVDIARLALWLCCCKWAGEWTCCEALFKTNHKNQEKLGRILVLSDAHIPSVQRSMVWKQGAYGCNDLFFVQVKNITTQQAVLSAYNLRAPFDNEAEYAWLRMMSLNGQTKDAFPNPKPGMALWYRWSPVLR